MGWLSDTFDKILDPLDILPEEAMDVVRFTHDPGGLIYNGDDEDSAAAAAAGGDSLGVGANPRLGNSRNLAMQDAFARNRLGIGQSRSKSRHVNPTGSNPKGSSPGAAGKPDPVISTAGQTQEDVRPDLPAGRYQYLTLLIDSTEPVGPDNWLYNLLSSKYARRL